MTDSEKPDTKEASLQWRYAKPAKPKVKIPKPQTVETVFARAVRFLTARALTECELQQKLRGIKAPWSLIEPVLERCRALGYLNDETLLQSRIQDARNKGYGPRRIAADLQKAGFSEAQLSAVEETQNDDDVQGQMRVLLMRRLPTILRGADAKKARERAVRYLISRGFEAEGVFELVRSVPELSAQGKFSD